MPEKTNGKIAGPAKRKTKKQLTAANGLPLGCQHKALNSQTPLPIALTDAVIRLQEEIGMPVWLLMMKQNGRDHQGYSSLGTSVLDLFRTNRHLLTPGKPIALVIDSPGGYAGSAFRIADLITRRSGAFTAVVPRSAKSAATLLALGAKRIIMAECAELGPLDAQRLDLERESTMSALDEVQALERLNAAAMDAMDEAMILLVSRSGKKLGTILPHVLRYVTSLMRPLMENIDVVQYTQMSRALKVAEEYAIRLMKPHYGDHGAAQIARHLVEHYPEHGFAILQQEASSIGINAVVAPDAIRLPIEEIASFGGKWTALGPLQAVSQKEEASHDEPSPRKENRQTSSTAYNNASPA